MKVVGTSVSAPNLRASFTLAAIPPPPLVNILVATNVENLLPLLQLLDPALALTVNGANVVATAVSKRNMSNLSVVFDTKKKGYEKR